MASTASIPVGASTSGHVLVQSVSRQTLQLFVCNNRFSLLYRTICNIWVIFEVDLEGQRRSMASTASIPVGASTSGHVLGVVGIPSDPPVICW